MKTPILILSAIVAIFSASCSQQQESGKSTATELFNGANLDGWSHVLVGDGVAKENVWKVEDGVLICKGEPLGYLFTNESYQDFKLSLEWRWAPGGKPGNSGVLLRIAGEPIGFMPQCVEAQLKHENAGDLWGFRGAVIDGPSERVQLVKDHKDLGDFKGIKKIQAAENPAGQWNLYEITVSGQQVDLVINGREVNQAIGLDLLAGPIGLQSEGAEIHFRNIRIESKQQK